MLTLSEETQYLNQSSADIAMSRNTKVVLIVFGDSIIRGIRARDKKQVFRIVLHYT